MKKLLTIIAAAVAVSAFAQGKIETYSIHSNVLGVDQNYNVYLPEGYSPEQHYPLVFLLHGLTDTFEAWKVLGRMDWVANELISSGECRPVVIVMPNAGDPNVHEYQNGYFNVPGWSYEDYFFKELLPAVEAKFNCGGSKGQRAIMGLSMGGGGSVVYAQHHPDMFSSCYAMSGWLDNESDEVSAGSPAGSKFPATAKSVRDNSAIKYVQKAAPETLERLRTVKWFVDCGDDDFILYLSLDFYRAMRDAGVPAQLRIRDGVHNWEYWHISLRQALPFASRNFN
ncbi:MAG: esterase family protein [Bacteroidales bacterium]|nr:esterase family protein [Bacteroidales bacterium]